MKLQTPKGTSDYIGERAQNLNRIIKAFSESFELFGFNPIKSPMFEYASTLKGKYGADEKLIYEFKDKGSRELALRYDLTVPLARIVGTNQFSLPAKFYNIGSVFRYDRPQKGRTREFIQADVDVIGSESSACDAELIACMSYGFNKLKLNPIFRINNRNLMNQVFGQIGISESKYADVLRAIDKLDKIGTDGVSKELESIGVKPTTLIKLVSINGNLSQVKSKVSKLNLDLDFSELESIFETLSKVQLNNTKLTLDLSLARGLDYYTGNVYEIDLDTGMSLGGGGRYDQLISELTGKNLTGIGMSVGVSRLLDLVPITNSKASKVFVIGVDSDISEIVSAIRKDNVSCSYNLNAKNLKSSFNYADKQGFELVIIVGKDEIASKKYVFKNLKSGKEEKLTISQIISKLK